MPELIPLAEVISSPGYQKAPSDIKDRTIALWTKEANKLGKANNPDFNTGDLISKVSFFANPPKALGSPETVFQQINGIRKRAFNKAIALGPARAKAKAAQVTAEFIKEIEDQFQRRTLRSVEERVQFEQLFPPESRDVSLGQRAISQDPKVRQKATDLLLEQERQGRFSTKIKVGAQALEQAIDEELEASGITARLEEDARLGTFHPNNVANMINQSLGVMAETLVGAAVAGPVGATVASAPTLAGFTVDEVDPNLSPAEKFMRIWLSGVTQAQLERIIPQRILKGGAKSVVAFLTNSFMEGVTEGLQGLAELTFAKADNISDVIKLLKDPQNLQRLGTEFVAGVLLGGIVGGTQAVGKSILDGVGITSKELEQGNQDATVDDTTEVPIPDEQGVAVEPEAEGQINLGTQEQQDQVQEGQETGRPVTPKVKSKVKLVEIDRELKNQLGEERFNQLEVAEKDRLRQILVTQEVQKGQIKGVQENAIEPDIQDTQETTEDTIQAAREPAIEGGESLGQEGGQPEGEVGQRIDQGSDSNQQGISISGTPENTGAISRDGDRTHKFATQIVESPDLREDFKEGLIERGINYTPESNDIVKAEARAYLQRVGINKAIKDVINRKNNIPPNARSIVGQLIILNENAAANAAEVNGDIEAVERHIDNAIDISQALMDAGMDWGRGIKAFDSLAKLSSGNIVRYSQRKTRNSNRKVIDNKRKLIDGAKKAIDKGNEEAAKKVADEIEGKPKKRRDRKKSSLSQDTKEKIKSVKAKKTKSTTSVLPKKKLASKIIRHIQDKKNSRSPITAMVNELFGIAKRKLPPKERAEVTTPLDVIKLSAQFPITFKQTFEEAKAIIAERFKNNPEALKQLSEFFDDFITLREAFLDKTLTKVVKEESKKLDIQIADIVKKHFSKTIEAADKLSESLVKQLGVNKTDGDHLARLITRDFITIANAEKQKQLVQQLTPREVRNNKEFYKKLIELSNLGTFNSTTNRDAFADRFKLPRMTPAFARTITRLAEEVEALPTGSIRQLRKTRELLGEIEKHKGISRGQVIEALAYANILSGTGTHVINVLATFTNIVFEMGIILSAPKNWRHTPTALMSFYQGLGKGKLEAYAALFEGDDPLGFGRKLNAPATLELMHFTGRFKFLNMWKYARRSLVAGDIFLAKGAQEFAAKMKAIELAKNRPRLTAKKRTQLIEDLLNNTQEKKRLAEKQALSEGLKQEGKRAERRLFNRRVNQLLEDGGNEFSGRPDSINETSRHFASRATFNYTPEGVLGIFAEGINTWTRRMPLLKGIVPFTNIVANVANIQLDYGPVGIKRAFWGHTDTPDSAKFGDERRIQMSKVMLGTVGMTALYAIASEYDDDDDPFFQVTAFGYRNRDKNFQLNRSTGRRDMSFKVGDAWIPFQFSPLAIPLAIIGHMQDKKRYDKEAIDWRQIGYAVYVGHSHIFSTTMLKNLSDFFTGFLEARNPELGFSKLQNLAARATLGASFPNFVRQWQKELDPTVRDDTSWRKLVRQIPIASHFIRPMLNILGEPIKGLRPVVGKFASFKQGPDVVWDFLAEEDLFIPAFVKNQTFGDRRMEPEEAYQFTKRQGKKIRAFLEEDIPLYKKDNFTREEMQADIKRQVKRIREEVKLDMLDELENRR